MRGKTQRGVVQAVAKAVAQEWFTSEEAAVYLRCSVKALLMRISRGSLTPDCFGERGRGKQHMFRRGTLDKHYDRTG